MNIVNIVTILILIGTATYYNVLWDITLLLGLILISYLTGSFICIKLKKIERIFIQTIIGLGLIGYFIWISIILRINNISVYIIAITLICLMRKNQLVEIAGNILQQFREKRFSQLIYGIFNLIMSAYIILGSYPIYNYDALVKHVPITLNLINKGEFPINVTESIVYGEVSLLRYTYTYVLMLFGGNKVIVLFEVAILILIFIGLMLMMHKYISNKFVDIMLLTIYFSTPLIINRAITINPDILPILFLIPIGLWIMVIPNKAAVDEFPIMAMLCGFSAFSKLTTFPYILTLCIIFIILAFKYIQENKKIKHCILKIFQSIIIFLTIFLPNALIIWFYTGNPVFPFYNKIFQSQYYSLENFSDPFDTNPLTLSIKSLLSMVFDTHKNIEMVDGGLGYYLLLLPLVLMVILMYRNKSYLYYTVMVISSYVIGIMFTSNIRYLLGSYMVAIVIIVVAIGYIINLINSKKIRTIVMIGTLIILVLPNVWYIKKNLIRSDMLQPNSNLTQNPNFELLSHINHEDTRVLSYGDEFKGEFKGEYYNFNWYNTYLNNKLISNQINSIEYLGSFDYFLYKKDNKNILPEIEKMFDLPKIQNMLTVFMESDTHILYKVNRDKTKTYRIISEEEFNPRKVVNVSSPYCKKFTDKYNYYQIKIKQQSTSKKENLGRWQINWYDKDNKLINVYLKTYKVDEIDKTYESPLITTPSDSAYGVLYINSHTEEKINVESYGLIGIIETDILQEETDKLMKN